MEEIRFEWDENKNQINQKKHQVSFEEAKTVFYDEEALVIDDPEHSQEEERFIILGLSTVYYLGAEPEGKSACGMSLLSGFGNGDSNHLCAEGDQKRDKTVL